MLIRNLVIIVAIILSLLELADSAVYVYNVAYYPNPTMTPNRCNVPPGSLLCDPDRILSDNHRTILVERLKELQSDTFHDQWTDVCKCKGISVGIALTQSELSPIIGGKPEHVAEYLHSHWVMDQECAKSALIVFTNKTKTFMYTLQNQMPIISDELAHILVSEAGNIHSGKLFEAFSSILQNIRTISNHRTELLLNGFITETSRKSSIIIALLIFLILGVLAATYYWFVWRPKLIVSDVPLVVRNPVEDDSNLRWR
ncbi:modulator of levamisole receptor-1 domain-containing protein [Ditylenchus destructor]|uniref:Modulator of levamisole receptor-1 domain-containing protein n=1 Tax=Ditylenchus destructor TaxID=166010 RepID=A0AAD4NGJ2_9BILA|nr:modulator of levamisole receptor-1 domain-containing protein [Ditylenchus destructor]